MAIYKLLWISEKALLGQGSYTIFYGICMRTNRIFSITRNGLVPIMLNDVVIDGSCEEEHRCLNTACELNKSSVADIKKRFGNVSVYYDKLPIEKRWSQESIHNLEILCKNHPEGGLINEKKVY